MMIAEKLFYRDCKEGINKSFNQLFQDINSETTFNTYCKCNSFYDIFKNLIISLINGKEIVLLDTDFTTGEIEGLIGDLSFLESSTVVNNDITIENFYDRIRQGADKWKITLFTSGTTGHPKRVTHTFQSLTRFVKESEKHKDNVWGFAYNPTHIAGLQVFFQALLNQNSIIRLFGLDRDAIFNEIAQLKITNISATPTFYRLLLPFNGTYESMIRLTSGGEKFDQHTISQLSDMFPNARITNVYASTEAGTLFASNGNDFIIKTEFRHLVKVADGELLLHKSLLGDSTNIILTEDWYATGDLVSIINEEPLTFNFISRKNEMINVGGYKVNPTEVEDVIRKFQGIKDVFIYAKSNRILGHIICCDIVRSDDSLTEKNIREFLQDRLQEFKIPRLIKFVSELQTTRTGKMARNK